MFRDYIHIWASFLLQKYDCLMIDEMNDTRIIGSLTITVLLGIALVGMDWEARVSKPFCFTNSYSVFV